MCVLRQLKKLQWNIIPVDLMVNKNNTNWNDTVKISDQNSVMYQARDSSIHLCVCVCKIYIYIYI